MECRQACELLADYSVENLSGTLMTQVREHLDTCASCAQQLAGLNAAGTLIERLERLDPPDSIWQTVQARGERYLQPAAPWFFGLGQWRQAFGALATAVIIVIVSMLVSVMAFRPHPPGNLNNIGAPALSRTTAAMAPTPVKAYIDQHAAVASRDPLSDPVSMGLVTLVSAPGNGSANGSK
jgi:hypothetical protein